MTQDAPAKQLSSLRELAQAASQRGEGLGKAIKVDPQRWAKYAGENVAALIEGSSAWDAQSRSVSRQALWALADLARNSEGADRSRLAREVLWVSLAWGHGTTYRLARKRAQALLECPDDLAVRIFGRAQDPDAAEALFDSLRHGDDRVKYWGPNFFTKFLYFSAPRTSPAAHLIVDVRVRSTLAGLGEPESSNIHSAAGGFGARTYGASLALMNRFAIEWDVAPDAVEYAAFTLG